MPRSKRKEEETGGKENRRQGRHQKKTFLFLFSHSLFLPIPFLSLLHSSTTLRRRPYRLWMGAFTPTLFHSFQFSSSSSHLLPLLFNVSYAKALKICHLLPRIPFHRIARQLFVLLQWYELRDIRKNNQELWNGERRK